MDHHPSEMARLCRDQARQSLDSWTSATLLQMAEDYEALARVLEKDGKPAAPQPRNAPPFMVRD